MKERGTSTSFLRFCAPFLVAAGFCTVQPCAALPPNTGITLVTDVAETTVANDAFWRGKCTSIPANALFLVVKMGDVIDFFKPADAGTSYCEMLQAHNKHEWSANGLDWQIPDYHTLNNDTGCTDDNSCYKGGSAISWPEMNAVGDSRAYLTLWGHDAITGGCCSTSYAERYMKPAWSKAFTLSYALPLQPLPPNTGMSLVTNVAGTTKADDSYWAEVCKRVPLNTLFIVVDMGSVRDFFKPITAETTYCEMLQAYDKHQWSANGVDWFEIEFRRQHNGGSASDWPRDKGATGDERSRLSIWGTNYQSQTGGCCSTSTAAYLTHPSLSGNSATYFGQSFTVSYALPLQPLPPNTGMTLVVDVAGTTQADDTFWAEQCKKIPSSTQFLVLDMGAVRDYFRPTEGSTFCEMLQSYNKQQWSSNGVVWVNIDFWGSTDLNGGSSRWWPRDEGSDGDERAHLSRWGSDRSGLSGGCCSSSTAVDYTNPSPGNSATYFGQSFVMSYGVTLQPLPVNTGMSLVTNVIGPQLANDAYWTEQCTKFPPNTAFIVLDMGASRDFIKPVDAETTFCNMLQSRDKHQWSANGADWGGGGSSPAESTSTQFYIRIDQLAADKGRYYVLNLNEVAAYSSGELVAATSAKLAGGVESAKYCIDGNVTDGSGVCHNSPNSNGYTDYGDPNTWLRVTYDTPKIIDRIVVTNRPNFESRIEGATISITADADGAYVLWSGTFDGAKQQYTFTDFGLLDSSIYSLRQPLTAFSMYFAINLQPLPPNTGMSLLTNVAGTTLANDDFWAEQCQKIPSSTLFLVLDMGAVRDFFKPTEGSTYCDMLQSHDKHQWSPNGVDWFAPDVGSDRPCPSTTTSNSATPANCIGNNESNVPYYYSNKTVPGCCEYKPWIFNGVWYCSPIGRFAECKGTNVGNNGGSNYAWPLGAEGDLRDYLSSWGADDDGRKGGCCSTSTAVADAGWGQSFTLSYALPLQLTTTSTTTTTALSSTDASKIVGVGPGVTSTLLPTSVTEINNVASEAEGGVGQEINNETMPTGKSSSSSGTIVGVVVSLFVMVAVIVGLFMMRKKEQTRQRALTRGGGNRQPRQGRNAQVYNNAAFDAGTDSGNDSEEDDASHVNRNNAADGGASSASVDGNAAVYLASDPTQPARYDEAKVGNDDGSSSVVVYATYAGSHASTEAEEPHYDMPQDEYAALEAGKSVYSSSA